MVVVSLWAGEVRSEMIPDTAAGVVNTPFGMEAKRQEKGYNSAPSETVINHFEKQQGMHAGI
jgi:hypothetical protein